MGKIHLKELKEIKNTFAHDQPWKWGAIDLCDILKFEKIANVSDFINC